jgi:4-amino-4-deoxy-L-arabinose transferase-like glycosyltransferase
VKLRQSLAHPPSPALVSRQGAKRLPRTVLVIIALAYLLAGFVGRAPWKSTDIASTGLMTLLAEGQGSWLSPSLLGTAPDTTALLPYWMGAVAMQAFGPFIDPHFAARIPFILMLAGTFALTWFGVYYLALSRAAQPVAFAFGGEASPKSYARSIADGGLLALIGSLGLAQIGHEVGPQGAQLFFSAMVFASQAALSFRIAVPAVGMLIGLVGLALSGAPTIALILWSGALALQIKGWARPHALGRRTFGNHAAGESRETPLAAPQPAKVIGLLVVAGVACFTSAYSFNAFSWKLDWPSLELGELQRMGRLLLWFVWPLWPMIIWTVWQWRRQLLAEHLAWPLLFAVLAFVHVILSHASDGAILLSLPALAALAAFALPTLTRRVSAFIDWFTLVFFSAAGAVVWVMWGAMLTGWPEQPAANVRRLVPGFELQFSWWSLLFAAIATCAWIWLVRWRISRHRTAIWKSLVLPAGGTVWAWVLLMTLWMPVFDYARSYVPLVTKLKATVPTTSCVDTYGLTLAQAAALKVHGPWQLAAPGRGQACQWLISTPQALIFWAPVEADQWEVIETIRRPSDNNEELVVLRRR